MEEIKIGDNLGGLHKVLDIKGGPGRSGMGIVYICYHSGWDRIAAVKTFQRRFFSSIEVVNSFKLEALAWISLETHPFIVKAITVEVDNGQPFLWMEYIPPDELGRNTLTDYLRFPISLKNALKWGIQFCHAMEHSITHGVSPHRDIKPDNIMINSTQDLKITDFGLAKLWNKSNFFDTQLTALYKNLENERINKLSIFKSSNNNIIAGTPPWMAPEQFEGIANIRTDIYSFGVVLYQMMNHGNLPFIAYTLQGFKKAHTEQSIPQFESKIFPIVEKCLTKSPEDRYFTFKDLRLDLEELYRSVTGESFQVESEDITIGFKEYAAKGYAFLSLGMYDEAIQELNKALTYQNLGVGEPEVLTQLGMAYIGKSLPDKALNVLNKAITLSPENELQHIKIASAYMLKALMKKEISINENAKKHLDKAFELNPTNVEVLHGLGIYYTQCEKDHKKAMLIFEKCLELAPNDPLSYWALGKEYEDLGMSDNAIEIYKKGIQINPLYEDFYSALGVLYSNQKKYEEAYDMIEKALQINPVSKSTHFFLGLLYEKQGKLEQSLPIFQKLVNNNPNIPLFREKLEDTQSLISKIQKNSIEKIKSKRRKPKKQV